VSDIRPVVAANRSRVEETLSAILELLDSPRTAEEILTEACARVGINITNIGQQCLMNLTVMAYLGYLLEKGRITVSYESNRQIFSRV
jgi:predicted transcriptional regulator